MGIIAGFLTVLMTVLALYLVERKDRYAAETDSEKREVKKWCLWRHMCCITIVPRPKSLLWINRKEQKLLQHASISMTS